jgi:endonuclease YncB( thermonuclease family)
MRRRHLINALVCLELASVVVAPVIATPPEGGRHTMTAKCVKVVDGDTLIIRCEKRQMIVDLQGVDAPEIGQPWGKEVRSFVADMVHGRRVEVMVVDTTDGTATARVTVDGEDLSRLLVNRGLAWGIDGGELEDLTDGVRESPCGLWLDPDPVPPWEFRDAIA